MRMVACLLCFFELSLMERSGIQKAKFKKGESGMTLYGETHTLLFFEF